MWLMLLEEMIPNCGWLWAVIMQRHQNPEVLMPGPAHMGWRITASRQFLTTRPFDATKQQLAHWATNNSNSCPAGYVHVHIRSFRELWLVQVLLSLHSNGLLYLQVMQAYCSIYNGAKSRNHVCVRLQLFVHEINPSRISLHHKWMYKPIKGIYFYYAT